MNKNEVLVYHTVRKDADGKPLQTTFPAYTWRHVQRQQMGNYPKQGRWMEVLQTVEDPPEAKAPETKAPAPKRTPAKRGRKPKA